MFGASKTGKDDSVELLAADANLVASGVSKDATCEQLKEFIENKGVTVTDIELISLAPGRRTNSFRVAIKTADFDKAMDPNVWPYRVSVRRYRPKQDSWASQSAQAGGNVAPDRGQHGGHGGHGGRQGGAQHRYRQGQYAPSAPAAEEFHLPVRNRFNGLEENVSN